MIGVSETWLDENATDTESICMDSHTSEETVLLHLERGMVEACDSSSTNAGVTTQPRVPMCVYRTLNSSLSV